MYFRKISINLLTILRNTSSREVIVLEGARQVGKTTLVRSLLTHFEQAIEINLETDLDALKSIESTHDFEQFQSLIELRYGLRDTPGTLLFIDEAQESSVLGRYVRSFKEEWKHTKVILSGSSMTRLFRTDQRIPVGRYTSYLLTPLTFHEFLVASGKDVLLELVEKFRVQPIREPIAPIFHHEFLKQLDSYLAVGGLPQVVDEYLSKRDWRRRRREILLSQEEDFVRKSGIESRVLFTQGLKAIASNLGFPSKYTQISENHYEAKKLIGVLKNWKLVYEVEQKGSQPTSSYLPKRYLYDLGIAQDLREHPFPNISTVATLNPALRTPLGGLLENALLLSIINHSGLFFNISGWRRPAPSEGEVDFIWRHERAIALECKAALKVSPRTFSSVIDYLTLSEQQTGFVVSLAPFVVNKRGGKTLITIPFYLATPEILVELTGEKM